MHICHDSSDINLALPQSPSDSKRFPYLKSEGLTQGERERLIIRLTMGSDDLRKKFALVVDRARESLEKQKLTSKDLQVLIKHATKNKLYDVFKRKKTIHKLFLKMTDHWSFFDYEFLGLIIDRFCTELQADMARYEMEFKKYCQRRLCEIPADVFQTRPNEKNNLYVKCDHYFDKITLKEAKELEERLAKLLDTELYLLRVEEGCVQLVFGSLCDPSTKFPLNQLQREQLSEMKILCLIHEDQIQYDREIFTSESDNELITTEVQNAKKLASELEEELNIEEAVVEEMSTVVKVEGQHIRGSPLTISAKSPVEKIRTQILSLRGVKKPWGVAINQRGEVTVTEESGDCVSVFSPSGEKLRTFGTYGSDQEQFQWPRGVALDGEYNILVADCYFNRIQKFTPEGQFLTAVGAKGKGPLQFNYPIDIVLNAVKKKVYVTDCWNHCVQVLNSDLTFSSSFGKPGSDKGQFAYPHGIACDSTGKVYVADCNNYRVQVFTAEGKFLKMFGRRGAGRGELSYPVGVAIDSNDMVYVSEYGNGRVSVFTSEGVFVTSFGSHGEGPGQFKAPYGVAVDNSGVVYVCDLYNNRVQIF